MTSFSTTRRLAMCAALGCLVAWLTIDNGAHAQVPETVEGILTVVWGDPHPSLGSAGEIRYELVQADGRTIRLQLTGQDGLATSLSGKRVAVSGAAAQSRSAQSTASATTADTMLVSSIAEVERQAAAPFAAASVSGYKRVIYLLVKFSDDTSVPHPPSFYLNLNNPDTPPAGSPATVNGFFRKTSGYQFWWMGDVGGVGGVGAPGGWLTLPQSKSYYAPCGWNSSCTKSSLLADHALALGRTQGIDFKAYDNINLVLSNDLDCCAYGGSYYSSVDNKVYGTTLEPPWGQDAEVYAHEMGHSLGLPHSGFVYYAYDSPWDVMSAHRAINGVNCGSYPSANGGYAWTTLSCREPGDGYIAAHRNYLGWIPPANQVVTNTSASITVPLEGSALPIGAGIKMITICLPGYPCSGSSAHYITVEARVKGLGSASQFDNGIPAEGVIIHDVRHDRPAISGTCFFNNQSGWAQPIDATPGDYNATSCSGVGLSNAHWQPGQVYNNPAYNLSIAVWSRSGSTFTVAVNGGAAPAVTTDAATDIRPHTATLNGTVNPNGISTDTAFEYGTTTAYGGVALAQTRTGSSSQAISASVTLSCAMPYHFRTRATSTSGTRFGADKTVTTAPCRTTNPGMFDGDGKTDLALYRASSGTWYIKRSTSGYATYDTYNWGTSTDVPVAGDYDGDGRGDLAVYRPSSGTWYILLSSTNYTYYLELTWGLPTDRIAPGDYDGDGRTDLGMYRPSNGTWYILLSSTNYSTYASRAWGFATDSLVPGDYDGDGTTDLGVYRPSNGTWYILQSSTGFTTYFEQPWGISTDIPVPGDYDGDGRTDLGVYRPDVGMWYLLQSSSGYTAYHWGVSTDTLVPADYDADGRTDPAVYRPSTGMWYILQSSTGFTTYLAELWGVSDDIAILGLK